MAVVVEGGLALVALVVAWLFRVPLRDMFPAVGAPLVSCDRARTAGDAADARDLLAAGEFQLADDAATARTSQWLIDEMFPSRSIAQFAMVAVLAGVGEELLFRGALQSILGNWTTPVIGLVITSLLFGLAHALSKLYFLFAVAVGAFLGWMTLKYNDLVAPMVAHGVV